MNTTEQIYIVSEGMVLSLTAFRNKADAEEYVKKYAPTGEAISPAINEIPLYPTFKSAPVPFGGTL